MRLGSLSLSMLHRFAIEHVVNVDGEVRSRTSLICSEYGTGKRVEDMQELVPVS